jgi:uncharacterized OB-fold protein
VAISPLSGRACRILPELEDATRPYWTAGEAGELRIAHCRTCQRYIHPPEQDCPACRSALEFVAVSGDGTVFTYTVAHQQFHTDVPTPFVIALVELLEQPGLRLVTNIVDCDPEALVSGLPVHVRFEEHAHGDETVFVPVFAPALI